MTCCRRRIAPAPQPSKGRSGPTIRAAGACPLAPTARRGWGALAPPVMFRPVTQTRQEGSGPGFVRAVGTFAFAAAIFNVTVGGGIFRLPATAAASVGTAAPLAYVVCGLVMGCVALCFAEAGSRVPLTGGPYAYVEAVFGRFPGFLAGVLLWMLGTTAMGGVASAFADGAAALLGIPGARVPVLVAAFATIAWINIRGVEQGARLIVVLSAAKLLPLLLFVGIGLFSVVPANLAITAAPEPANLARAAIVLVFAFSGVESALAASGEVKDPTRTIPRALVIAMTGVTLLYIAVHMVAHGILGPRLATETTDPLATAFGAVVGPWGTAFLLATATVSRLGYTSGMALAVPRALWKFADDGLLPRVVASIHPRFRTPHVAILVQVALVLLLGAVFSFEDLAVISNLAALLLYGGCAAAVLVLRARDVKAPGTVPYRVPGGPVIPVVTIALIGWLLTSITAIEWRVLASVLGAASLLYVLSGAARRGRPAPTS